MNVIAAWSRVQVQDGAEKPLPSTENRLNSRNYKERDYGYKPGQWDITGKTESKLVSPLKWKSISTEA